jgi:DNA helicase-2/ATP-dependent DNA helicase PcrA
MVSPADLTQAQHRGVEHDGHTLIIAGPGSGKTKTSVARAVRILRDPRRTMLMVTFSREGAEEMRRRIAVELGRNGVRTPSEHRLLISTFHSLAIRHLRQNGPLPKVLSPMEQSSLWRSILNAQNIPVDARDEFSAGLEVWSSSVDRASLTLEPAVLEAIDRYQQALKASRRIDLYGVMRLCALRTDDGRLPTLPYTDMLVDEAQDTDELQKLWVFAHARAGCSVALVADDDQSIYEWRQALGSGLLGEFSERFSTERVFLVDNFRSVQEVVDVANRLIAHNTIRIEKTLVSARGPGGIAGFVGTGSSSAQYELLAGLLDGCPAGHTCGVLARTNASLDSLEVVLRAAGISYQRIGRSVWDQPAVAGFVSLLHSLLDASPIGLHPLIHSGALGMSVTTAFDESPREHAAALVAGAPLLQADDPEERAFLSKLSGALAAWRKDLQVTGSVDTVVLDAAEFYSGLFGRSRRDGVLLDICGQALARMSGSLSSRLGVLGTRRRTPGGPSIVLLTLHGSKGLEYDTVHIIDARHADDGATVTHAAMEAERRLFYVGLTRARDRLFVWAPNDNPHRGIAEAGLRALPSSAAAWP